MANKKELVKVAKELNKVLGLNPAIETDQDKEELQEKIATAAELIEPEDNLTSKTIDILEEIMQETQGQEVEPEDELEEEEVELEEEEVELEEEEEKEKPAPKPKAKKEKKAKEKKAVSNGVTRSVATATVIKNNKSLTLEEWAEKSDSLFVEKGGSSNLKESGFSVRRALQILEAFGVVKSDGEKVVNLQRS